MTTFRPVSPYPGPRLIASSAWLLVAILKLFADGDVVKRDTLGRFNFLISRVWKLNGAEQWRGVNSLEDQIPPTYGHMAVGLWALLVVA